MIDAPEVHEALDSLAPTFAAEADWNDVLRRSRPSRRSRRSLLLVAAAVAAAVPAIAAASFLVLAKSPGPRASAVIESGDFRATFSGRPAKSFTHPGSKRVVGFTRDLRWALRVEKGDATRVGAELVARTRLSLCDPCTAESRGTISRVRGIWWSLLHGRVRLVLDVDGRVLGTRVRFDAN
jgi:hypothetical protein